IRTTSADPVTTSSSSTYSRVTPYFTQHTPPAFVATLPPMVDHGELAGSGGYHKPCAAAAAHRSSLTTPGCTTANRSSGSIRTMSAIASSDSTTHPSVAFAPPESPVPAPRATTDTPCCRHTSTALRTSSVL